MKELEKLTKNLENRKRVTQKALDILNKIVDELDELYEKDDVIGQIKLSHCISNYRGNTYCYRAFKDKEEGYKRIPTDINSLDKCWYAYNNINMKIDYITKEELLYILHNIKQWILEKTDYEKEMIYQFENIFNELCK